jgi:hypothetical protein
MLWTEHDNICILSKASSVTTCTTGQIKNLHAVVLSPNEKAAIFMTTSANIKGRYSKLLVSALRSEEGQFSIGCQNEVGILEKPLINPSRDAIAVQASGATDEKVTVLIAHSDGSSESHEVSLGGLEA